MKGFPSENIRGPKGRNRNDNNIAREKTRIDAEEKREHFDKIRHTIEMKSVLAGNKIADWIEKTYAGKTIGIAMKGFIVKMSWKGVLSQEEMRNLKMTDEERVAFIGRCIDRHNRKLERDSEER